MTSKAREQAEDYLEGNADSTAYPVKIIRALCDELKGLEQENYLAYLSHKSASDDWQHERDELKAQVEGLTGKLEVAEHEIDILRIYGNKDCTAMADEALAKYKEARE